MKNCKDIENSLPLYTEDLLSADEKKNILFTLWSPGIIKPTVKIRGVMTVLQIKSSIIQVHIKTESLKRLMFKLFLFFTIVT